MLVAKLNDGRCVVMLKRNESVLFDSDRRDWCSKLCDQEEKATEQINFIEEFLNEDWINK